MMESGRGDRKAERARYYAKYRERIIKTNAEYYKKNKERIAVRSAKHYIDNKESYLSRQRKRVRNNPTTIKAEHAVYAKKYRERLTKNERERCKKRRDELHSQYIKAYLARGTTMSKKDIPQELIEVTRILIKIKRKITHELSK